MKSKAIINFVDYVFPIIIFSLAFFFLQSGNVSEIKEFGEFAFLFLFILLIIKPLNILFPRIQFLKPLMIYRREVGHVVFYLAAAHGLFYLYIYNFILDLALTFGLLALSILLVMFLTSNKFSIRKLGIWWKRLHNLIYLVLVLTLIHIFLVSDLSPKYIILTALVVILKIAERIKLNQNSKKRD